MALNFSRGGRIKDTMQFIRFAKKLPVFGQRSVSQAVSYRDVLSVPETKVTALNSLLRVASDSHSAAKTATVGVWIHAGSRYETDKNNGVAHILEHLAFKGTKKRSELDIETEAELNGMLLSAHASREVSSVQVTCLSSDLPKAVELLSDVVLNNSFSDKEIDRARNVAITELQNAEDDSKTVVMDYLYSTAFQSTPLARSVLGTSDSLGSLTSKDVVNFVKARYNGPFMVLSAAGGVDHSQLVSLAEQHFGTVETGRELQPTVRCRFTGSEVRARYDDLPLAHVAMAIEGPAHGTRESLVMEVAQYIIGKWDRTHAAGSHLSSRLASACAQEELCHSFESFHHKYSDTSLWGCHFVADRLTIEDMMFNLQGEWMRLCSGVTEHEVARAKNQLKTAIMTKLSTNSTACNALARQILFNYDPVTLNALDDVINRITAETVRDVCTQYVYDKCPALASVGPVENLPDYGRIRGSMYWLRL